MGHFGRRPIQLAWYGLALPALALNYFGQGALLLRSPEAAESPFFAMVPQGPLTYALVALSATGRSTVQLLTKADEAPVPYALSGLAALVYIVATVALATDRRRLALAAVLVELVGVLLIGLASVLLPDEFADATVWSQFGRGYGYVPLVLPVIGLWWVLKGLPIRGTRT